jgi:hypothetical protein
LEKTQKETKTTHHHAAVDLVAVNQKMAPLNMRTVRLVEMSHVLVEAIENSKNAVVKRSKILLGLSILIMASCARVKTKSTDKTNSRATQLSKTGIQGTWIYLGWENVQSSSIISGGFVDQEKYWDFSNSEITISDNTFKSIGTMDYSSRGDTLILNKRLNYVYAIKNDTLRMKELFSESNVWKVLIKKFEAK